MLCLPAFIFAKRAVPEGGVIAGDGRMVLHGESLAAYLPPPPSAYFEEIKKTPKLCRLKKKIGTNLCKLRVLLAYI